MLFYKLINFLREKQPKIQKINKEKLKKYNIIAEASV